jgi:hypothetical protein
MLQRPTTGLLRRAAALLVALLAASPGQAAVDCFPWSEARGGMVPATLAGLAREVTALADRYDFIAEALARTEPGLCLSDEMSTAHGFYEVETNRIAVDARLPAALQTAILLHELRHLWQFGAGVCPSQALAMDQYGLGILALEADATTASLYIAWEMKSAGRGSVWDALAAWPMQTDIAEIYADTMRMTGDPRRAASAAFAQWYVSERRVHSYFYTACSGYLDRQDAGKLIPSYEILTPAFYDALCVMPDGRHYDCALPPGVDP